MALRSSLPRLGSAEISLSLRSRSRSLAHSLSLSPFLVTPTLRGDLHKEEDGDSIVSLTLPGSHGSKALQLGAQHVEGALDLAGPGPGFLRALRLGVWVSRFTGLVLGLRLEMLSSFAQMPKTCPTVSPPSLTRVLHHSRTCIKSTAPRSAKNLEPTRKPQVTPQEHLDRIAFQGHWNRDRALQGHPNPTKHKNGWDSRELKQTHHWGIRSCHNLASGMLGNWKSHHFRNLFEGKNTLV